jgi:hypothetical protein
MRPLDSLATLIRVGLVGTERANVPFPVWDAAAYSERTAPTGWLDAMAQAAVELRAGYMPARLAVDATAATPETQRELTAGATHTLLTVLRDYRSLLPQWHALASDNGWRVPHEVLPVVIPALLQQRTLLESNAGLSVLGTRGLWLAAQHPQWRELIKPTNAPAVWETGSAAERAALIANWRQTDPDLARQRFNAGRKSESAETVVQWLATFVTSLSPADEPILDPLLDAKAKSVRVAAARLLAQIPSSAYAQRVVNRVRGHLQFTPPKSGLLKRKPGALHVTLPETESPADLRDFPDSWQDARLGARNLQLQIMVAACPFIPLMHALGASPEDWLTAAGLSDEALALLGGVIKGAQHRGDRESLPLILQYLATLKKHRHEWIDIAGEIELLARLSPAQQEAQLHARAPKGTLTTEWLQWLEKLGDTPLSPASSSLILNSLQEEGVAPWLVSNLCAFLIRNLHHLAAQALVEASRDAPLQGPYRQLVEGLEVRLRFQKELTA